MTNLLDTSFPVLVFDISPDFRTWEDHLSSLFHSEEFDELSSITGFTVPVCCTFNELKGTFWLSDLVFPGFSDAVEASTVGSLIRHLDTKFIIGLDFDVSLSSLAPSCVLFDIALTLLMGLKWLLLNKHKRWFHSSRVKFPLVSMAASWFLVSMYLIWILRSKLILSNNKMYNIASWRKEFAFEETKSTVFRSSIFPGIFFRVRDVDKFPCTCLLSFVFPWRTVTIRFHKSSAGTPSNFNPASKEMIYDSVELCETEVCFLHIQLIGTNVWLPKTHNVPPDVDFEFSRSPAKSESWKKSQSALFCSVSHMTILFVFTCVMNVGDQSR